jgi:PIN domain nuclease of toxin-antitoxin system
MPRPILLDTRALLWIANKERIAQGAMEALAAVEGQAEGLAVSPISSWEVGQLVSRGRLALPMEPLAWFQSALDVGIALAPMPLSILVGSSFLPGPKLRDPADRIVAAARAFGYRLMTRDGPLLALGRQGHLDAIAC